MEQENLTKKKKNHKLIILLSILLLIVGFSIAASTTVKFDPKIKTSKGIEIPFNYQFKDDQGNNINPVISKRILKGTYNLEVEINGLSINKLYIYNLSIEDDIIDFVDLEDSNKSKGLRKGDWINRYSINPTYINSSLIIVTVLSKGNRVYKCDNYNFTTNKCNTYYRLHKIISNNLLYNISIIGSDPSYGEINLTNATWLDSNYGIIQDVYPEVKDKDDYGIAIPYQNMIRAIFYHELEDGNVIDLRVKNPSSADYNCSVRIYEQDTDKPVSVQYKPIGWRNDSTFDGYVWYHFEVSNLTNPSDTFDIKVDGDSRCNVSFDYIYDALSGITLVVDNSAKPPTNITSIPGQTMVMNNKSIIYMKLRASNCNTTSTAYNAVSCKFGNENNESNSLITIDSRNRVYNIYTNGTIGNINRYYIRTTDNFGTNWDNQVNLTFGILPNLTSYYSPVAHTGYVYNIKTDIFDRVYGCAVPQGAVLGQSSPLIFFYSNDSGVSWNSIQIWNGTGMNNNCDMVSDDEGHIYIVSGMITGTTRHLFIHNFSGYTNVTTKTTIQTGITNLYDKKFSMTINRDNSILIALPSASDDVTIFNSTKSGISTWTTTTISSQRTDTTDYTNVKYINNCNRIILYSQDENTDDYQVDMSNASTCSASWNQSMQLQDDDADATASTDYVKALGMEFPVFNQPKDNKIHYTYWSDGGTPNSWYYSNVTYNTSDNERPYYRYQQTNGIDLVTLSGETVNFNITCMDRSNISKAILSTKIGSNAWTNETAITWLNTYYYQNISVNKVLTGSSYDDVYYKFYCYDNATNILETDQGYFRLGLTPASTGLVYDNTLVYAQIYDVLGTYTLNTIRNRIVDNNFKTFTDGTRSYTLDQIKLKSNPLGTDFAVITEPSSANQGLKLYVHNKSNLFEPIVNYSISTYVGNVRDKDQWDMCYDSAGNLKIGVVEFYGVTGQRYAQARMYVYTGGSLTLNHYAEAIGSNGAGVNSLYMIKTFCNRNTNNTYYIIGGNVSTSNTLGNITIVKWNSSATQIIDKKTSVSQGVYSTSEYGYGVDGYTTDDGNFIYCYGQRFGLGLNCTIYYANNNSIVTYSKSMSPPVKIDIDCNSNNGDYFCGMSFDAAVGSSTRFLLTFNKSGNFSQASIVNVFTGRRDKNIVFGNNTNNVGLIEYKSSVSPYLGYAQYFNRSNVGYNTFLITHSSTNYYPYYGIRDNVGEGVYWFYGNTVTGMIRYNYPSNNSIHNLCTLSNCSRMQIAYWGSMDADYFYINSTGSNTSGSLSDTKAPYFYDYTNSSVIKKGQSFTFGVTAMDDYYVRKGNCSLKFLDNGVEYTEVKLNQNFPSSITNTTIVQGSKNTLFYWNFTCNDTALNTNTTLTFNRTIQNSAPTFSPQPSTNFIALGDGQNITLNITNCYDADGDTPISSYYLVNGTLNKSYDLCGNLTVNWTLGNAGKVYNITVIVGDMFTNESQYMWNIRVLSPPDCNNPGSNTPISPTTYLYNRTYNFTSECYAGTYTIDDVNLYIQNRVNVTNDEMNNINNLYWYSMSNMSAGNYTMCWRVNTTTGETNNCTYWNYSIDKAESVIGWSINVTSTERLKDVYLECNNTQVGNRLYLYNNNTYLKDCTVTNSNYCEVNYTWQGNLSSGDYTFICNTTSTNVNYTSTTIWMNLSVLQDESICSLSFRENPVYLPNMTNATPSCQCANSNIVYEMYRDNADGIMINRTNESNINVSLSAGVYTYIVNTSGNVNCTSDELQDVLNVLPQIGYPLCDLSAPTNRSNTTDTPSLSFSSQESSNNNINITLFLSESLGNLSSSVHQIYYNQNPLLDNETFNLYNLKNKTVYYWQVSCNSSTNTDTSSIWEFITNKNSSICLDHSSVLNTPFDLVTLSYFNTTCSDIYGISNVYFESNISGSSINYTMSYLTANIYNISQFILPGEYYWKTYAIDITGAISNSSLFPFNITKRLSTVTITANKTIANITDHVLIFGNLTLGDYSINITLERNSTLLANSTYNISKVESYSTVNIYRYCILYPESQNYTSSSACIDVSIIDSVLPNITQVSPQNSYQSNLTRYTNISFICNATDNINLNYIHLYISNALNESLMLNTTRSISGLYNSTDINLSLPIGNYSWLCQAEDTSGNKVNSSTRTILLDYIVPRLEADYIALAIFFGGLTLLFSFGVFVVTNLMYRALIINLSLGMITADMMISKLISQAVSAGTTFLNLLDGMYNLSLWIFLLSLIATLILFFYKIGKYISELPKLRRQNNNFRGR